MVDHSSWRAWRDRMRDDGESALRDLLEGKVSLGSLTTAEPVDAVDTIMYLDGVDPEIARGLDQACADLCADFHSKLSSRKGVESEIEIRKFADLIAIIRRLLPERTVVDFHRRFGHWNRYFEKLAIDRQPDLRFDHFQILALSQNFAAKHGVDVSGLPEFWISICAESGGDGRYPKEFMWVGMLGLRYLPLGGDVDAKISFSLRALARWATTRKPGEMEFKSNWSLLQAYFPHDPGFWKRSVQNAILIERGDPDSESGNTNIPIMRWWLEDIIRSEKKFKQEKVRATTSRANEGANPRSR